MVAVVGLLIEIASLIFIGIVNALLFLLRRMDITNSLLVSGTVQLLTFRMDISAGIRWVMFIGLFIICLVIQHIFKVGKIAFGIFSVIAIGVITHGWTSYDSSRNQLIAMSVAMIIAGIFNVISWGGITAEREM